MTNEPIEERLTAYVLGELSEADQESVEKLLEADEDAQRMLEEIRVAVGLSREALNTQPSVALWPEQRAAIKRVTASPKPAQAAGVREKFALRRLALAASFLMIFGGLSWAAWIGLSASSEVNMQTAEIANLGEDVESIFPGGVVVVADPDLRLDQFGIGTFRGGRLNGETIERSRNLGYIGGAEDSGASGDVGPDGSAVVMAEDLGRQGQRGAVQAEVSNRAVPVRSAESSNVRIVLSQPGAISVARRPAGLTTAGEVSIARPDGSDVLVATDLGIQQRLGSFQTEVRTFPPSTASARHGIVLVDQSQTQATRSDIEKMQLLLEGAASPVNGSAFTRAVRAAVPADTELERLSALGYLNGGGGFGGGGGGRGGGGFGGVGQSGGTGSDRTLAGWYYKKPDAQSLSADGVEVRVRVAGLPRLRYQRPPSPQTPGTESYTAYSDNGFVLVGNEPLSTFSIDVDTASYANMRRFLRRGQLPPPDAVRIEELINYFDYDYAGPDDETPFAAHMVVASAPWRPEHRLVRIALKGADMTREERPAANLVFLLDVSGSMKAENKLPLVKRAIALLVRQLTADDRVAMVTYAGSSGLALPSTRGDRQDTILGALKRLEAGGSTNGGAGIELAYRVASENFVAGGINRVILATDGDFNVGVTDRRALERIIEDKARGGVFLTALGFGMGNLKDSTLETLSNKGNGNYAYIDTLQEARKVFVDELMGTLVTIAKDVKIQVEFNPSQVAAYRLIGYENRALAAQDFNDDAKDAGEIGAGHTVTALYEIVPAGMTPPGPSVDPLRYRDETIERPAATVAPTTLPVGVRRELLTLKVRYKEPQGSTSKLLTFHLTDPGARLAVASADFKFAVAVASFGQMLRQSPHVGAMDYNYVMALAEDGMGADMHGYRSEFIDLLRMARPLVASTYRISTTHRIPTLDLQLLAFQELTDGTWKVRMRSGSDRRWYSEGDAFQSYQLLSIDPDAGCVVVFIEQLGRPVQICKVRSNN